MTARAIWTAGTVIFGTIAGVVSVFAMRLPWAPPVAFDVLGGLWLLQNVGPIGARVTAFLFAALSLYCLVRAIGSSR
jgi:hypothetical protein